MRPAFKYGQSNAGTNGDDPSASHSNALKLMASWVSAIADQVRNPVAGLTAAANLIEKQMKAFRSHAHWDPSIVEEAVRLMQERLARFDNYMMELSGFTRDIEVRPTWIDLKDQWLEIESFVLRRVTGDVQIHTNFEMGRSTVYADFEKLKLILSAVIVNAVESCGADDSAEVSVIASRVGSVDNGLLGTLIEVRDNGPGFSDAALIAGLNPFFTTKEAGTGLGLAMVEKYVLAHGGYVRIGNGRASGGQATDINGGRVEMFFPNLEL